MRFSILNYAAAVAGLLSPAIAVKILMAGDSTMADGGVGHVIQGWGVPFTSYMGIEVINLAIAGTSARTYTRDGHFKTVVNQVEHGDFVMAEFGHNDVGGNPRKNDKADAGGDSDQTVTVRRDDGTIEVVQTFVTYMEWFITDVLKKGGIPIVSSQTPKNNWVQDYKRVSPAPRFVPYAQKAAEAYSNKGATYINHYEYVARLYETLGYTAVSRLFLPDNLHTNAAGAEVVAQAFISGLLCENHPLARYLNDKGKHVKRLCH